MSTPLRITRKNLGPKLAEYAKQYQGYIGKIHRKKLLHNLRDKRDRI